MSGSVLVFGASGTLGVPVVKGLLEKGERVKAATRGGKAILDAEPVAFEYGAPVDFDALFAGVDRAFLLVPSGYPDAFSLVAPVVDAAAAQKVKLVFLSVLGADADESIPYRRIERKIEASGSRYVILRPNWFDDNFHTFWKAGIVHGQIQLPAGDGKTSFIDARDIAASAVAALTTNKFDGRAFNLTGPEALSYAEAAKILSKATGKEIGYTAMSDEAFIAMLTSAGVPEEYGKFLATIFAPVRAGYMAGVTGDVTELTGKPALSLEAYAKDHANELQVGS
ncbi:SDR family oxidoreductase [Terriglobus albidus]|uniref:SDR family oxidoreductase n=1 Tax=Terriglobus albidus TaxID=1592106 RepID=UPI0021E0E224|nr:SDR family oxidoreductase [Terriglobus albidus]